MEERHHEEITAVCTFVQQRLDVLETVSSAWLAYFTKFA
jgi:hypothetical protein